MTSEAMLALIFVVVISVIVFIARYYWKHEHQKGNRIASRSIAEPTFKAHEDGSAISQAPTVDHAPVRKPRTGASVAKSTQERMILVGDRTGQPPTERMVAAVERLGFKVQGMDFEQANKLLGIRDYVLTLVDRTPQEETPAQIRALIEELLYDPSVHEQVRAWSWHTRDHDVRRIPKDALRRRCEQFLKNYR